jgi:ABC-type transporter Mla subunit MlaD
MSMKANYFKLGLFVLVAMTSLVILLIVIGSGRVFQQKITIETYFNESVQGLDVGSKVKYRGVVIGEVTKITFTYVKYQQDKPMSQRLRYVLVEAQLQPKLLGGRAATSDITNAENIQSEVEKGMRVRSAAQGITGTNYLEIDYVEPPPPLLTIDWTPDNAYIPSTTSTVAALINSATEVMERIHNLDIETTIKNLNVLLATTNARIDALDTKEISQRTTRTLAKLESTLDQINAKKLSDEGIALMAELRESNAELKKTLANPALQKLPDDAAAALAKVKELVSDPKLPKTVANLERTLARFDRILGGGEADLTTTIENLRQITDNLRDLTEDTKRYPANVIFGTPPRPLERAQ